MDNLPVLNIYLKGEKNRVWCEWLILSPKTLVFTSLWKHCGNWTNCWHQQFLHFPESFLWENFPPFSSNLQFFSGKTLSLEQSKICRLGKGWPFSKQQILDSSNFKDFADDNLKWKLKKVLQTGRTHSWKRKNCLLRAISPFPAVFSKDLNCRLV